MVTAFRRRDISSNGETTRDIHPRRERLLTLFLLVNSKWRNWSAPFALNQRRRVAPAILRRRISGVRRDNSSTTNDQHRRAQVNSCAKPRAVFSISARNFWLRGLPRDDQSPRFTARNKPFATIASYYKRSGSAGLHDVLEEIYPRAVEKYDSEPAATRTFVV